MWQYSKETQLADLFLHFKDIIVIFILFINWSLAAQTDYSRNSDE